MIAAVGRAFDRALAALPALEDQPPGTPLMPRALPPPVTGCGSCTNCVSRTGQPCTLGTRPPKPRVTPPVGRVLSGRDFTTSVADGRTRAMETASSVYPGEPVDAQGFRICKKQTCSRIDVHRVGDCLGGDRGWR